MTYSTLVLAVSQVVDGLILDVNSLYTRFVELPDRRKRRGVRYALAVTRSVGVVARSVAKLAGQDTPPGDGRVGAAAERVVR